MEQKNEPLLSLLPTTHQNWSAEKTLPLPSPKDLYNYIDGGAELYISYGFSEALSRTYKKGDQQEVVVEIYDLIESRNAFGVFTQTREHERQLFGQGTYEIPGAIFFWKDRYFISLSAWEANSECNDFMKSVASYIDSKIPNQGKIPFPISLLPAEGLVPDGYRYFHHYIWINSYFFISDENVLNIDNTTNAVLAKYADGDKRKYLLIVEYANQVDAKEAFSYFSKAFFPGGLHDNCILRDDQTWLAASIKANIVVGVFNASTKQAANQLLTSTMNNFNL